MSQLNEPQRYFWNKLPTENTDVCVMPGIGPELTKKLNVRGFHKAYSLLGQFLVFEKDRDTFVEWLRITRSIGPTTAGWCYDWLSEWWLKLNNPELLTDNPTTAQPEASVIAGMSGLQISGD